jgi:sec-independent protein translocase protein TatA
MALLNINPLLLSFMPSPGEGIFVLLIIVVLFGGKKIPELAKGLGKGIREFNDAKDGIKNEIENGGKDKEKIQAPNTTNTHSNA